MKRTTATLAMFIVAGVFGACTFEDEAVDESFRSSPACWEQQQARVAAEWTDEIGQQLGPQAVDALMTKSTRQELAQYVHDIAQTCPSCVKTQTFAQILGPVAGLDNLPPVPKHYGQAILDGAAAWADDGAAVCDGAAPVVCVSALEGLGWEGQPIHECGLALGGLPVEDTDPPDTDPPDTDPPDTDPPDTDPPCLPPWDTCPDPN